MKEDEFLSFLDELRSANYFSPNSDRDLLGNYTYSIMKSAKVEVMLDKMIEKLEKLEK